MRYAIHWLTSPFALKLEILSKDPKSKAQGLFPSLQYLSTDRSQHYE